MSFQRNFQYPSHDTMQLIHSFPNTARNQKEQNLKHVINTKHILAAIITYLYSIWQEIADMQQDFTGVFTFLKY